MTLIIALANIHVAKHELPTSIIGTVLHVRSRRIVIKKNIANVTQKTLQVIEKISQGINHGSMFVLVEFSTTVSNAM